ncbi:MAG: hypothetical protein WCA46_17635 [Actinocatenispora sp.]
MTEGREAVADHRISRRRLLVTGSGIGLAAAGLVGGQPTVAAEPAVRAALGGRPVSMAMHVHSCFSEGGSYAGGGGGASMMAQLDQAAKNDIDVVWWTDHDWRMEAYGYLDGIAFDGTDEDVDLSWHVQNEGTVTGAAHAFVATPHSPREPGRAMRVRATGPRPAWGTSYLWAKAGNSFYSTNITDTSLTVDVLAEQLGPDAEAVIQVETSYRPATAGRPAGVYVLEYRLGTGRGRMFASPLTGVVSTIATGGWQTLTMPLLADVRAFWPDLIAEDSGLARLRFGVRARNHATARAVFDHLRFFRTRDPLRWPVALQQGLRHQLRARYPTVTQYQATEVSMVRHLNIFMANFELYPYPPRGQAPSLDRSVAGTERVVRWYQDRGALVQYNHPPPSVSELVATRALGTDLIEIGNPSGGFTVIRNRIALYDVAARNAIFLTATSQIDDHNGRNWLGQPHLYLTSVWSQTRRLNDLIAALGAGQAWWYHQRLWRTGQLDLGFGTRRAMGRAILTSRNAVTIDVIAENLPADATVQVVVGLCDRRGALTPSITKHSYPATAFTSGAIRFAVPRGTGHYLRTEVYDATGLLLGFSNPVWVLPPDAVVDVPARRRLRV